MLEDTYGHSPIKNMFDLADVYGIKFNESRASRKKIKLAVIGAGGVAQSKHLPAITRLKTIWEPVEVSAICIRNEQQGKKTAAIYGCKWYKEYREMLANEEVDGVLILASDNVHYEASMYCIEKGLHVMVEKPITRSLVQSEEMCKYADQKGIVLMTVSNKRYSPPYRRARQYIINGPISQPAMFVGKFNLGYSYVDIYEGGAIHIFDICRYLKGDVSCVRAAGVRKYRFIQTGYRFDNAICLFEFVSGAVGSIYTSSTALSLKPWERVEVYAEKKWLAVEDQYKLILNDSEEGPSKVWTPIMPNTLIFDEEFGGFMGLIENFIQCIRGMEKPLVSGWDGHRAYELAVASHLAIKTGDAIKLPLSPISADKECKEWLGK